MKKRSKYKPLLNDAWVYYLNNLEAIETGNAYKLLIRFNSKKQRDLYTKRSLYGNYQGPLPDRKLIFQESTNHEFKGPLKGISFDYGSGKDETVKFQYTLDKGLPVFINPDFKL